MSKVYQAHLDKLAEEAAMKDIYSHMDEKEEYLHSKIEDLRIRLEEAVAEIDRLEEENAELRDNVHIYRAHYDNGRV